MATSKAMQHIRACGNYRSTKIMWRRWRWKAMIGTCSAGSTHRVGIYTPSFVGCFSPVGRKTTYIKDTKSVVCIRPKDQDMAVAKSGARGMKSLAPLSSGGCGAALPHHNHQKR